MKCLPKNTTQCPRPEQKPLDLEATTRPIQGTNKAYAGFSLRIEVAGEYYKITGESGHSLTSPVLWPMNLWPLKR